VTWPMAFALVGMFAAVAAMVVLPLYFSSRYESDNDSKDQR
jgi:hypothetical protein